jgi:hypothetical protein
LEYGIDTESWYAELALRKRANISAIGSVMVMAIWPFSLWFPPPKVPVFNVDLPRR